MSLTKNQFSNVKNPSLSRTITHSLRKSACCKLLSVLQLKTLLTIKPSILLILGLNISHRLHLYRFMQNKRLRPIYDLQADSKVDMAAWPTSCWPSGASQHSFKWPEWTFRMAVPQMIAQNIAPISLSCRVVWNLCLKRSSVKRRPRALESRAAFCSPARLVQIAWRTLRLSSRAANMTAAARLELTPAQLRPFVNTDRMSNIASQLHSSTRRPNSNAPTQQTATHNHANNTNE